MCNMDRQTKSTNISREEKNNKHTIVFKRTYITYFTFIQSPSCQNSQINKHKDKRKTSLFELHLFGILTYFQSEISFNTNQLGFAKIRISDIEKT